MHVKILSEGSFLEDAGRLGNGEGSLDVRALPPCRSPPQEPDKHKDKDDAGKARTKKIAEEDEPSHLFLARMTLRMT